MKTKNSSGLVVGIVITVFVIIIVGVVIIWSSGYFNQNKKTLDRSTSKIDKAIGSMAEFDLDVYDGKSIRGDALVELMQDLRDDNVIVSVGVKTLSGTTTYYNYGYSDDITVAPALTNNPPVAKSDVDYVNPNGAFVGDIKRNKNDEITCILFTNNPDA